MIPQFRIIQADYVKWLKVANKFGLLKHYFHALLSDWTYNLESVLKRNKSTLVKYGKDGSFARQMAGFMGMAWDTAVAYNPKLWRDQLHVLKPGALTMGFSHARKQHLLGWAAEMGGFEIESAIGLDHTGVVLDVPAQLSWVYGTGKATGTKVPGLEGIQYGNPLRPAWEPVIVANAPYENGMSKADSILAHGAGGYNIDAGRKFTTTNRFPTTAVIIHHPECVQVGWDEIKNKSGSVKAKNCQADPNGMTYEGDWGHSDYEAPETEKVAVYDCHPDCPSWRYGDRAKIFTQIDWRYEQAELVAAGLPFYYGKVQPFEREAFCWDLPYKTRNRSNPGGWAETAGMGPAQRHNHHPTLKPIMLTMYLASLLLPSERYAPRAIIVPCCGTGSEIIGCLLAGWEIVVGIDITKEYIDIARPRVAGWLEYIKRGYRDVDLILATHKKEQAMFTGICQASLF